MQISAFVLYREDTFKIQEQHRQLYNLKSNNNDEISNILRHTLFIQFNDLPSTYKVYTRCLLRYTEITHVITWFLDGNFQNIW